MDDKETTTNPHTLVAQDFSFSPRMDLTLLMLSGKQFRGADCTQSLFNDTLLRESKFDGVTFSRSDFNGARFESCNFSSCVFQNADLRSTLFARCRFEKCDLSGTLISDCEFFECDFVDCLIERAVFSDCLVERSRIERVSFERSSVLRDTFRSVDFDSVKLGNCTFMFGVLLECNLTGVSMNAESVGYVYGLDLTAIKSLDLIYLGEEQAKPAGVDIVQLLEQQYIERRWETGLAMLALNVGRLSAAAALPKLVEIVLSQARKGLTPKRDEIRFLECVIAELDRKRLMPLLAANTVAELIASYLDDSSNDVRTKEHIAPALQSLLGLVNSVSLHGLRELEALRGQINELGADRPVALRVTFHEQPSVSVADLINEFGHCSHTTRLERIESGSVVEVLNSCTEGAYAFLKLLVALNGCAIMGLIVRSRIKALIQKNVPREYVALARKPSLAVELKIVRDISKMMALLVHLPWTRQGDQSGLSMKNVKRIDWGD